MPSQGLQRGPGTQWTCRRGPAGQRDADVLLPGLVGALAVPLGISKEEADPGVPLPLKPRLI